MSFAVKNDSLGSSSGYDGTSSDYSAARQSVIDMVRAGQTPSLYGTSYSDIERAAGEFPPDVRGKLIGGSSHWTAV